MFKKLSCALITNGLSIMHNGCLGPCCNWQFAEKDLVSWSDYPAYNQLIRQPMIETMDQGKWPSGCKKCQDEESINLKSLRTWANEWYRGQAASAASVDNPVYDIELKLSSFCNLRCIMCGPYASSSWAQEIREHSSEFETLGFAAHKNFAWMQTTDWYDNENFYNFFKSIATKARRINISGGEPFTLPYTSKILDALLEIDRKNVGLQINTNLTKLSPGLWEKLQQFSDLRLILSLEGVGTHNDYLRYPSKFADIEKNIKLVTQTANKKNPIKIIHHVLQHTSVYTIPALANFCRDHNALLTFTKVQSHEHSLDISGSPPADLEKLVLWAEEADWLPPITRTPLLNLRDVAFSKDNYQKFHMYVSTLDKIRGTNYQSVFNPSTI